MNKWIKTEDQLPIDVKGVKFYGSIPLLIVSGGVVEFCEMTFGPLPEPWYKMENFHKGYITHWMPLPEPPKD